jgi:hypothetical protein
VSPTLNNAATCVSSLNVSGITTLSGNVTCSGFITTGNFNSFLGGLRINGSDTGNTIWQNTGNLGISANTGNNITFAIGNGGEKMRVNASGWSKYK